MILSSTFRIHGIASSRWLCFSLLPFHGCLLSVVKSPSASPLQGYLYFDSTQIIQDNYISSFSISFPKAPFFIYSNIHKFQGLGPGNLLGTIIQSTGYLSRVDLPQIFIGRSRQVIGGVIYSWDCFSIERSFSETGNVCFYVQLVSGEQIIQLSVNNS